MKQRSNRHRVRRLFIMGAGASYSASKATRGTSDRQTPLDRDFARRILELQVGKPRWVNQSIEHVRSGWKDLTPFEEFGLEQAVIRQLGHLEFIDAIHPRRRQGAISPYEWLNHLTHLIAYVLRHSRESARAPLRRFVENVFPAAADPDAYEDRVITFNYDDLLDRHVLDRAPLEYTYFDRITWRRPV